MPRDSSLMDMINACEYINKGITFIGGEQEETYLSYRQLYQKALGVLRSLQARGIGPGAEAVLQIEDPQKFLIIFWACLLGGIIPVPVPVANYDENRLLVLKIWKVLNNPYLVTRRQFLNSLLGFLKNRNYPQPSQEVINRTIYLEELKETGGPANIYRPRPDETAFLQFSSGTTGDPKGIILTHENLITNINAMIIGTGCTRTDSTLSWMPLTHDLGLIGFHLAPLAAKIDQYLMPTTLFIHRPSLWLKKAGEHRISVLSSPNFGLKYVLNFFKPESVKDWDLSQVRLIINGAEPISADLCNRFLEAMEKYRLKRNVMFTVYGLAEASLAVTFPIRGEGMITVNLDRNSLSIGQKARELRDRDSGQGYTLVDLGSPVRDCKLRISDQENRVLDDGVVGYIQIKGKNVTRGYYNNPEATTAAFTADGWLNTGDLGFLRNGRLVITGRAKEIIFFNGQNYYPQDIERITGDLEGFDREVAACGVFNPELQKDDLILFVIYKKEMKEFGKLATRLKKLVNQQIGLTVTAVIPVEKIPRTSSGKFNRLKLVQRYQNGDFSALIKELALATEDRVSQKSSGVPISETEKKLIVIWQEILGGKHFGIDHNFFELGGNSLKTTFLISKIYHAFGVEIPLREVFEKPTIRDQAKFLDRLGRSLYQSIPVMAPQEFYPASAAQKRLFFLNQIEGGEISNNIPVVMRLDGIFDEELLERTFKLLIKRHEALRTWFELINGEPVQWVLGDFDFRLEILEDDLTVCSLQDLVKKFIRPFDLKKAPLFRVGLVKLPQGKHLLLFDIHHLITDGHSLEILIEEFLKIYNGMELPELKVQYKDFSNWHNQILKTDLLIKQKEYWVNEFREMIPVLNLPTDFPRPSIQSFEGNRIRFFISKDLTTGVKKLAQENGATLSMVLLTIYYVLLHKSTGQEDIVVGSAFAGRPHPELERVMGVFVNILPLRNYPVGGKSFAEFLKEVRENTINAYENQDYQLDFLIKDLNIKWENGRHPVFDTMFILQTTKLRELGTGGFKLAPIEFEHQTSSYDFSLHARETEKGIACDLEYCTKLFKKETMMKLTKNYLKIIDLAVTNPNLKLSAIELGKA